MRKCKKTLDVILAAAILAISVTVLAMAEDTKPIAEKENMGKLHNSLLTDDSNEINGETIKKEKKPLSDSADETAENIADNGNCGDSLTWILDSDGVLRISGTGVMANYNGYDYYIPWYYKSEPIKIVIIEEGVTLIETHAFYYCEYLTDVAIPESVVIIGSIAFSLMAVCFGVILFWKVSKFLKT